MNPSEVLPLAFLIGAVCGLRAMTAPAAVAWGAHQNWLNLHRTRAAFMGSTGAVVIFTLLAVVELITDQLPSTPSRLKPAGLIPRIVLGGVCGACLAMAGMQSIAFGAGLGAVGGIIGAFAGHGIRARLVNGLKIPDVIIALLEDAVAIGGGLFIVSRF